MSNRLLQLARSATAPGTTTVVVNDWPTGTTRPVLDPPLPEEIRLLTLPTTSGGRLARWWHRQSRPLRVLAALRQAGIRRTDLSGVCVPLGLWNLTTCAVLRLALRRPITVDVVERHDPEQFGLGRLAPYFIRHRWSTFLAARLADRIIAISTALHRHFALRRPTLVVPPQVDSAGYAPPAPPSLRSGVRLLYAGTAGPKDLLSVVVEGIARLPRTQRKRVHLTVAGVGRDQVADLSDLKTAGMDELADEITFLGRVPRDRVLAELGQAHFSILVRPDAGYSRAGFPSKVPESLAAGCPVLLNHTSDLARYVTDGQEGLVLAGATPDDFRDGLLRALALDDDSWRLMSRAARVRASDFDYRSWTSTVAGFVVGLGRGSGTADSASVASSAALSR
ncbi:glycosyltransferase [Micromonospora sp. WP24]|uniref:glycosyltransferase n=1 Tax=Micromonospora sp. WP24 TaxID=2604469 RepID=UPI0016523D17|nr:glycosyltransferase [Micromonospora sp. WP24]